MKSKTTSAIILAAFSFASPALAQNFSEIAKTKNNVTSSVWFDVSGDGAEDEVMMLGVSCEDGECPVIVSTKSGISLLGYGKTFETGYADVFETNDENKRVKKEVPVVSIDGVQMAFDGYQGYPVNDSVSSGRMKITPTATAFSKRVSDAIGETVTPDRISTYIGDLTGDDVSERLLVLDQSESTPSRWFLIGSDDAEMARGFSLGYPRIYVTETGLRILSVSETGLGVMDVRYKNEVR